MLLPRHLTAILINVTILFLPLGRSFSVCRSRYLFQDNPLSRCLFKAVARTSPSRPLRILCLFIRDRVGCVMFTVVGGDLLLLRRKGCGDGAMWNSIIASLPCNESHRRTGGWHCSERYFCGSRRMWRRNSCTACLISAGIEDDHASA